MREFSDIIPADLDLNPIQAIGKDWMLITAGDQDGFNTMTASWGGLGELWFKPVCFTFVRPQRHTYAFLEKSAYFTISFFKPTFRAKLTYCGEHSGRDVDKIKECGLTTRFADKGAVFFNEAELVLECRKIYYQDIQPSHFLDRSISKHYGNNDYHRMYIGEIIRALKAD